MTNLKSYPGYVCIGSLDSFIRQWQCSYLSLDRGRGWLVGKA